jgi:hypothetical protein
LIQFNISSSVAGLSLTEIALESQLQLARDTAYNLTVYPKLHHTFGANLTNPNDLLKASYFFSSRNISTVDAAAWNPLTGVMPMALVYNESSFPWAMGDDINLEASAEIVVPFDKCLDVAFLCIHLQNSTGYVESSVGGRVLCKDFTPYLICKPGK